MCFINIRTTDPEEIIKEAIENLQRTNKGFAVQESERREKQEKSREG